MTLLPVLVAKGLGFDYPGHTLFTGQSFSLQPGITLLRGDPGTGKTLLLRLLAGQLLPTRGSLSIHGNLLAEAPEAYMRQLFWIEPGSAAAAALEPLKPWDYLESLGRLYAQFEPHMVTQLVQDFSLHEHMGKPFYMLSTGTKRKVFLTAAFASGAAVTLLDEPFAALDKPSANALERWLDSAAGQSRRAWLVANHGPVCSAPLAGVIDLDTWQ